ncbi:hypothetical protein LGR54_00405 [Ancylobacter sp. Lp-2]|uniref:alanine--tRNA ligase-related protein n=1 Tax=Ancylobacter sp. Lp-2 TaxID=2881339 RepID=UPI001E487D27|nr:alanine--tRNA ligase-related protein [Ancylobacter sp. Lp-2]MCB4767056.1 hypothetical protein [Ancylobacter sp. Lp-2]
MLITDLHNKFLECYERSGRKFIKPVPVVANDDPDLMFIISGMVPFKKYFCGDAKAPHSRMYNAQPCIRTVDLVDVGDVKHLTYFEMLGNWSFGNVDRRGSITNAWLFLTETLRIPANRLVVTVFKGDTEKNIPPDITSIDIWRELGLRSDQIFFLGKDNFWGPAGADGPCGPCTEIHYDRLGGPLPERFPEDDTDERFMEIWNAGVFLEYHKSADGHMQSIAGPGLAAGAGLERLASVVQEVPSVYDTDEMSILLAQVRADCRLHSTGRDLSQGRKVVDHIRAISAIAAEGVKPGRDGPSHVLRRLIRRAYAVFAAHGEWDNDLSDLLHLATDQLGRRYPHLKATLYQTSITVAGEIRSFETPLRRGMDDLDELLGRQSLEVSETDLISLNGRHGLPRDIAIAVVEGRGGKVIGEDYKNVYAQHRHVSKGDQGRIK